MLLQAGDARIDVPLWSLPILYSAPIALMALVVSSKALSTPVKQCLSVPLLAIEILVPIVFTANHAGIIISHLFFLVLMSNRLGFQFLISPVPLWVTMHSFGSLTFSGSRPSCMANQHMLTWIICTLNYGHRCESFQRRRTNRISQRNMSKTR